MIQGEQWNKIVEKRKKHALNKIDLRESMYVHNFLNLFLRLSSLSERVKVTYPKKKKKRVYIKVIIYVLHQIMTKVTISNWTTV